MPRNVELLRRVRDQIMMDPESHYQGDWSQVRVDRNWKFTRSHLDSKYVPVSCATNACLAGWACMLSGDQFVVYEVRALGAADSGIVSVDTVLTRSRQLRDIETRARELLGIDSHESHFVFSGGWSTEETIENIDHLIKGHVLELHYNEDGDRDGWLWEE